MCWFLLTTSCDGYARELLIHLIIKSIAQSHHWCVCLKQHELWRRRVRGQCNAIHHFKEIPSTTFFSCCYHKLISGLSSWILSITGYEYCQPIVLIDRQNNDCTFFSRIHLIGTFISRRWYRIYPSFYSWNFTYWDTVLPRLKDLND